MLNPDKRYLVILADRQKGRFFTIFQNNFEDEGAQVFDEIPQKVKVEHTRPGHIQRHIKDHLHKHLKLIGERAYQFLVNRKIKGIEGIILGSHQELLNPLKNLLPNKLKTRVLGELITDINLSVAEITEKVEQEVKDRVKPRPRDDFFLVNQRVR
jgi:peptide subunit release factor 1 (eRF1)